MKTRFRDRTHAGKELANQLTIYANRSDAIVLGLPRGGVPVAYEVAKALNLPLDICLVRKLGVPGHKELAMGAIASGGVRVLNYDVISWLAIADKALEHIADRELRELQRRDRAYRGDRPQPEVCDRTIILVDDGLATGATMRAAIAVLQKQQPKELVVAVPVAPLAGCKTLETEVDKVVCLSNPEPFYAIGLWYKNFAQTTDEQVRNLLAKQLATAS
ncbi:phosphoribosyltransferase [Leptolyngbya sp. Heron Island J]|uniref:phosphoribosyltransferase n=1 Tax=Leptolyngbya sp. Heron Island J TaxID=1385935 RepID=UPI00041CDDC4|nr:phosphoribosyltransferase [Leptolyngbya sp. Heron Island J]